jgi:hypothetical protein
MSVHVENSKVIAPAPQPSLKPTRSGNLNKNQPKRLIKLKYLPDYKNRVNTVMYRATLEPCNAKACPAFLERQFGRQGRRVWPDRRRHLGRDYRDRQHQVVTSALVSGKGLCFFADLQRRKPDRAGNANPPSGAREQQTFYP